MPLTPFLGQLITDVGLPIIMELLKRNPGATEEELRVMLQESTTQSRIRARAFLILKGEEVI